MALITCKDCDQEFSTGAAACPRCGAKRRVPKNLLWTGWIALAFAVLISSHFSPDTSATASQYECANFDTMKRRLNSSKSLEDLLQWKITEAGYDCYSIGYLCFKGNGDHDIEVMCDQDKLDGSSVYMHSNKGNWLDLKVVAVNQGAS